MNKLGKHNKKMIYFQKLPEKVQYRIYCPFVSILGDKPVADLSLQFCSTDVME